MVYRLNELLNAGAVGTLCLRYYRLRGKRQRWEQVRKWAESEFPGASKQTLDALIERCKQSAKLAERINRSRGDREFTPKEERELRGRQP